MEISARLYAQVTVEYTVNGMASFPISGGDYSQIDSASLFYRQCFRNRTMPLGEDCSYEP